MIGKVVGNYKITEKIGEGGMGAVYRGIDVMLEREVAIKVLRPNLASQPEVLERFRAEAVTLAKLNHPNIATLYSFLREGDQYFMVMEFVRGKTIDQLLRESGPMTWNRAIILLAQALEGVDHAHRMGIVHRDLKPANLMLTDSSTVKVMDFGIARALGTARVTRVGNVVGTLEYISPEQIRGVDTDARSDIYSLGVLLYEMLTGRLPFVSENDYELMKAQIEQAPPPPRTFVPQIPLAVEQAIMRALAKRREARYQTAGEFRAVLLGALGASTNPLQAAQTSYAAPATRLLETVTLSPQTGETSAQPRPTGPHSGEQPFAASARTTGSKDKSTRVDTSAGVDPVAFVETAAFKQQPAEAKLSAEVQVSEPLQHRTTGLSKLNRKHYAAAGFLIVALAGVPIVLMRSGAVPAPQPAAASEQVPAAEPAPPVEPQAAPAPAADEAQTAPADAQPLPEAATDTQNANRARPASTRATRAEAAAEAPPPVLPVAPQTESSQLPVLTTPAPAAPAPTQEQVTPPAQQNTTATTTDPNAKKEEKKKKGGFGGLMKKIFVGDKKKEEKKP